MKIRENWTLKLKRDAVRRKQESREIKVRFVELTEIKTTNDRRKRKIEINRKSGTRHPHNYDTYNVQ